MDILHLSTSDIDNGGAQAVYRLHQGWRSLGCTSRMLVRAKFSSGTPVVAFNATGLKDIVDHQQNGYLATPFEVDDLAKGIAWVLENPERQQKLRFHAREKSLQEFSCDVQARRYLWLYEEILGAAR